MKQRPISKTISLVIAWQLAFSPMALAVETRTENGGGGTGNVGGGGAPAQSSDSWTKTFADIMQGATAMGNALIQGMQQRYSQVAAQNQMNALTSQMNPSNCGANGVQQQCVDEIFPECNILNTRPNLVEPSACANGIDPTDPSAVTKAGVMMGYYNHFSQMENIYKNFNLETNATSNTGLGCMNAQADRLARTLKKREDEIDNLMNKMQKVQDKFKKDAEKDRNKIEDAQALLLGDQFKGRKSALDENSVQFGDSFADKGCLSVFNRDSFNSTGKSGGLKGIETALSKASNDKVQPGGFSATEFDSATASSLEKDIRKMADLASKNIQTFGLDNTETDKLTKAIPSAYSLTGTPSFSAAITESLSDAKIQKANVMKEVESYAGNADRALIDNLQNNKADFNFAIQNWEKEQKNNCLSQNSNISDLVANRLKIIDMSNSKSAQRSSDNAYAIFIRDTLKRSDITIEEKLRLISQQEGQNGNNRFIVNTQSSATVNGEVIEASTRMSPARFVEVMVKNCEQKFENNPNSQGFTGRQVVDKLQKSRQEIVKIQNNVAGQVKSSIIDRMLNCADSNLANANGVATCSAKELSSGSANFCVKRANACATNMRQCLSKAQEQVQKVTKKRDEAVAQYKANVRKNQEDLRKMYLQVEEITSVDGLNIANSLKQGLVLPADLKFNLDPNGQGGDKTQYITGLESLEIEDPDQYFKMMKANLTALKTKIHEQNVAVMNGTQGDLAVKDSVAQQGVLGHIQNVKQNMDKIMGDIGKYKQMCQSAFQAYMQGVQRSRADQMKASSEQQKNQAEFCGRYNEMQSMPGCENADDWDSVVEAAERAGGGSMESTRARAWRSFCRSKGADANSDNIDAASYRRRTGKDPYTACNAMDAASRPGECTPLVKFVSNCGDSNAPADQVLTQAGFDSLTDANKDKCFEKKSGNSYYSKKSDTGSQSLDCASIVQGLGCKLTDRNTEWRRLADTAATSLPRTQQSAEEVQAEFNRRYSNLGENRSAMCSSYNNSGNAVGKALIDAANTVGQGVINMRAAGQ